jgi:predicted nucleotidyltransferase
MHLSHPISSVIPGAYGDVLAVLARTDVWLSGQRTASLTRGPTSRRRVDAVLAELARSGIADMREVPPAKTYRLNRAHVAAEAIEALASQWDTVVDRIRNDLQSWPVVAEAAWLFGSAARGDGHPQSDIDLLLIRPEITDDDEQQSWQRRVDAMRESVRAWSGNELDVLDFTAPEFRQLNNAGERLVEEVMAEAIPVTGQSVLDVLNDAPTAS